MPQKKEHLQLKLECDACSLCATGLDVKHTVSSLYGEIVCVLLSVLILSYSYVSQDVLILSQFLRTDGCMLPRRITGLCDVQQKRITVLVAMAQKAGLQVLL